MYQLADKFLLYILGAIVLLTHQNNRWAVVILLTAFITSGIFECMTRQWLLLLFTFLYAALCLRYPELVCFLPLITYDSGLRRLWPGCCCNLMILTAISSLDIWQICICVLAAGISIYISIRTRTQKHLQDELIRLRDTSTELNLALAAKNQALISNQENEIHLATLQERNRIAREIHDSVGHMLSRCILQLGALSTIYPDEPLAGHLKSVNESLNTAMNNIRESVHDLRDESVDLKYAIAETIKDMRQNYDISIDYDLSEHLSNPVKYAFLMIIKEAMVNIIKHSDATQIHIILREHPGFYQLAIEDNGSGKELHGSARNLSSPDRSGMGLKNMRDRIESMHGTFHYKFEHGFKIFASVPKSHSEQK